MKTLLIPLMLFMLAAPAYADTWVSGSLGIGEFFEPNQYSSDNFGLPELDLELNLPAFSEVRDTSNVRYGYLGPTLGINLNQGSLYGFLGLKWHVEAESGFGITYLVGFGHYSRFTDEAFDLGPTPWLFRFEMRYLFRVSDDLMLGLSISHHSNGNFAERNPGTETVALAFEWR